MSLPTHLTSYKGHYYYQIKVPVDLKHHFSCTFIKKSLRTTNLSDAKIQLVAMEYSVYKAFIALRTSYRVSPTSKVKAEWARTQTGDVSSFVDAPSGGESGHKVINVFSLSYNFVF